MANPFSTIPIYIRFYVNRIDLTRLDTGETVSQTASKNFSNERLVVADYMNAEVLLKSMLSRLIPKKLFMPQLDIVIQQLDYVSGRISPTEQRILLDVAKKIGGRKVIVADDTNPLTFQDARTKLK